MVALRLDGRIDRPWRFMAIGIVLVVVVLFYADFRAFEDATNQIDVNRRLLQGTEAVLSSVKDAETSERGYLITGDKAYLGPYNAAVKNLPHQLDDLTQAAADAKREGTQVTRIRSLVDRKMEELKLTIDAQDRGGPLAAQGIVRTEEGKLTMDELRAACALVESSEYVSLFNRTRTSELHANRSRIIVLVGCLGLVLLLFRLGTAIDDVVREREETSRLLERWKGFFAGAGFGMFVIDPKSGAIVDMNTTFASMHGYSVDELRGKPAAMLASPEDREEFLSDLDKASDHGRHTFEHQHVRRNGTQFTSLIDLTSFQDGKETYWAGYCSDVTERKGVEDALRESEERFRTLASALPQLIWTTDATGRFEYVNPAWNAYTGWTPDVFPDDPWTGILHPEDSTDFLHKWNNSLASGNVFEIQARMRRAGDGEYRWFLCRGGVVRGRNGSIVRWLGGCTDVQEQVESSTQLKLANQALQRSNADLEQFAYAASHDLQEPLRMVSIYSQLLKEEFGSALQGRAVSYLDFAVTGAQRMSKLLKALLEYSRVDNEAPAWLQRTDANAAAAAALLNLQKIIQDTHAEICVGKLPTVRVPEIHLTQVFQNLIGNALKYRKEPYPPGEVPRVRIEASPHGDGQWLFSVRDHGIGIEAEFLTQIFGVFKRLHGSNVEGTGIGLALCQRIVERAGGRIWVESRFGEGSTFFFTLTEADANG
jgi:PAS domain S-box-containing protein